MARKRMISPEIWGSQDLSKVSPFARLVWIGLFSNADDSGRGNGQASYIRSILFPYDNEKKITTRMVDDALNEIAGRLSVVFYSVNDNEYYSLTGWNRWQKVDKPQASKIPPCDEVSEIIRGTFGEQSANARRQVPPNRIEKNKKRIEEETTEGIKQEQEPSPSSPSSSFNFSDFPNFYKSVIELYRQHAPTLWQKEYRGTTEPNDRKNGEAVLSLIDAENAQLEYFQRLFEAAESNDWIRDEATNITVWWLIQKRVDVLSGKYSKKKPTQIKMRKL